MSEAATLKKNNAPVSKALDYEKELTLARRLDWRFLLPKPQLGIVGLLGRKDSELHEALQHFSSECHFLKDRLFSDTTSLDLLVCTNQDWDELAHCQSVIKPGGYLYLEHKRQNWFFGAKQVQEKLDAMGFEATRAYWHRPCFENGLDIVPLFDKNKLKFIFNRNQSGVKGRLVSWFGSTLLRLKLVDVLMPCVSLVARKAMQGIK